ncbi:hypothetical protein GCM10023156_19870 [Novipirellula rosea]|uniref:Uncharacterized protein n=1 Tax=Novipirellula rosea TaxID=1031540 RepID=A0ABP8MJR2_9BACT
MWALSAELVDDVGGVAPVGVDETAADSHGGSVIAFPFATKDAFGERFEAGVDGTFHAAREPYKTAIALRVM